jgi:hypothetical protein
MKTTKRHFSLAAQDAGVLNPGTDERRFFIFMKLEVLHEGMDSIDGSHVMLGVGRGGAFRGNSHSAGGDVKLRQ